MYSEVYVSRRKRGMNSIMGYEASDEDIAACNPGMRTLRDEVAMAALTGVISLGYVSVFHKGGGV